MNQEGVKLNDQQLGDILLRENYISQADLDKAKARIAASQQPLATDLLEQELVTQDLLGMAVAEHFGAAYADLNSNQPPVEQVQLIPEDVAKRLRTVVFSRKDKELVITTDQPAAPNLKEELAQLFPKKKITIAYSLSEDIDEAFLHYRQSLKTRFSEIIAQQKRIAPELIDEIFSDALLFRASDIHFEPQAEVVIIRFRVDGMMQEAGRIDKQYYENLLNRIKVQAHLRIDEHFVTQDGALRFHQTAGDTDMRVSVVPTVNGEKVVLRLLSHYVRGYTLKDLGLSQKHEQLLETIAAKPFGMVMVTGPTGSGKSTTLYALVKRLNQPDVNITTIEDPVEYKIDGTNQIQVNEATGITFAKGLRSIVRQDPDVILVGEVRDTETAEISVNAALTGHLLFTTFHANDAATAIPRLLKMNIEPFLLASTLEAIIAQRLVRTICQHCKTSYQLQTTDLKQHLSKGDRLYRGKGCSYCNNSGYQGRTGIFEFIAMTDELQDLILTNPSANDIWKLARKQGARTLFEDGIDKVKAGITTMDELLRVAEPPTRV